MKNLAIEFVEKGRAAVVPLDEPPPPGPNQLLFETLFTGVTNGTERHALLNEYGFGGGHYPSRHGYQHVGRVMAVGSQVDTFRPGDIVFCGDYVGHRGWHITNAHGLVIKLEGVEDYLPCALFGVAGVAMRAVRRMRVSAGDNVLVAGQGPIGHFLGQCARAVGARVTVSDMLLSRREAAREAGAHVVLDPADTSYRSTLRCLGPFNFIFDACSAPRLLFEIFEDKILAHGGCIGMMAVRGDTTYPWPLLHGTEARIETSCHFWPDDLRVLLFLVQQGLVRMEPIISDVLSVEEAPSLYARLAAGDPELRGVVFRWSQP